jgi:cell division protein FtsB
VSGPARRPRAATAPPRPQPALGSIGERALGAAFRLRDSHLVDRLVRGRVWIGLLCLLLIGLVGLNVSLLKLNAAAGRNAEWAKKLRVENADLAARVSRLRSGQRIQASARRLGLVMPSAASVHYLTVDGDRDIRRALKRESFTPPWSDDDVVSATPEPAPVVPAAIPPAAPAATTGTQGATGATATPAQTSPPATGATGTQTAPQSETQQPGTGATTP